MCLYLGLCWAEFHTVPPSSLSGENEAEMAEKPADEDAEEENGGGSSSGDDGEEGPITEIRFVPSDKAACE